MDDPEIPSVRKNPEKEARALIHPSIRVNELADKMEKRYGTEIPPERRKFFESQIDRLEDVAWLLGNKPNE